MSKSVAVKMSDWQPIETAPKDGNSILLGTAGAPAVWTGYFRQERSPGMMRWTDNQIYRWTRDGYMDLNWNPTHWMPLPDPPDAGVDVAEVKPGSARPMSVEKVGKDKRGRVKWVVMATTSQGQRVVMTSVGSTTAISGISTRHKKAITRLARQ